MKKSKTPVRRCVGCGISYEESMLLRVVRRPDGKTESDPTGKKPGRGAYVCRNLVCLQNARKKKAFERSLSSEINENIYLWLEHIITGALNDSKSFEDENKRIER